MCFDIFISYAWTSEEHKQWVLLLAAQLQSLGFNIGIDEKVDYGSDLTEFMKKITRSKHVLLIVDKNYVERANNHPTSGVAIENNILRNSVANHTESWIALLMKDNPDGLKPNWLSSMNTKYFSLDSTRDGSISKTSREINNIWRWAQGMAPDYPNSIAITSLREKRLKLSQSLENQGLWSHPSMSGENIKYEYNRTSSLTRCHLGAGEYEFFLHATKKGEDSIYVYKINNQVLGEPVSISNSPQINENQFEQRLTSAQYIDVTKGQAFFLQNSYGCICSITLKETYTSKREIENYIIFDYTIINDEDIVSEQQQRHYRKDNPLV